MCKKKLNIKTKLIGGLGNQLFIYSAARRLSIINKSILHLDICSGFSEDHIYKRKSQIHHFNLPRDVIIENLNNNFYKKIIRNIHLLINKFLPYNNKYYIKQHGHDFDEKLITLNQKNNIYIEGYWQSEKYFMDIDNIIRDDLNIIPPVDPDNIEISNNIKNSTSVCVHIRFFNEYDIQNSLDVVDYLNKSFDLVESRIQNPKYFIFSNDFLLASALPILNKRDCIFIDNNSGDDQAYADLWLMTLCKHHIISNSTFSWWGAWLANNKCGLVISPKIISRNGIISWGFDGNLPSHWIKI